MDIRYFTHQKPKPKPKPQKSPTPSQTGQIYCLYDKFDDDIFYIGSTRMHIQHRLYNHIHTGRHKNMQEHIKTLGRDRVGIKCIESNVSNAELLVKEKRYIRKYIADGATLINQRLIKDLTPEDGRVYSRSYYYSHIDAKRAYYRRNKKAILQNQYGINMYRQERLRLLGLCNRICN